MFVFHFMVVQTLRTSSFWSTNLKTKKKISPTWEGKVLDLLLPFRRVDNFWKRFLQKLTFLHSRKLFWAVFERRNAFRSNFDGFFVGKSFMAHSMLQSVVDGWRVLWKNRFFKKSVPCAVHCGICSTYIASSQKPVWPEKNCQISIKVAKKWFH